MPCCALPKEMPCRLATQPSVWPTQTSECRSLVVAGVRTVKLMPSAVATNKPPGPTTPAIHAGGGGGPPSPSPPPPPPPPPPFPEQPTSRPTAVHTRDRRSIGVLRALLGHR